MPERTVPTRHSDRLNGAVLALSLATMPGISAAKILWSGDLETGNFIQWHMQSDATLPHFSAIPSYGRPKNDPAYGERREPYYGDGSLLEIVTSPVRQGKYAAQFTVKKSANGREPDDCDTDGKCTKRRTELTVQGTLPRYSDAMPYMSERWMSASHYVPANWNNAAVGGRPYSR